MPYRTNDIETARAELVAWHDRERRADLRRAGALLLWTLVVAGWGGMNASWSNDLRVREPAAVRVVMPTDFCAPEVLEEHGECVTRLDRCYRARDVLVADYDDINEAHATEIAQYELHDRLLAHALATCNRERDTDRDEDP
jgi:hypothetical protein